MRPYPRSPPLAPLRAGPRVRRQEKVERKREAKAETAAQLEKSIETELLKRLQSGTYGDIYNFPLKQYEKVLDSQVSGGGLALGGGGGSGRQGLVVGLGQGSAPAWWWRPGMERGRGCTHRYARASGAGECARRRSSTSWTNGMDAQAVQEYRVYPSLPCRCAPALPSWSPVPACLPVPAYPTAGGGG